MNYCSNCGTELAAGDQFCRSCGHKLGTAESPRPPSEPSMSLNLRLEPATIAPILAAAGAVLAGYLLSLLLYQVAAAGILSGSSPTGAEGQVLQPILSNLSGKLAGISLYVWHQIRIVGLGNLHLGMLGFSGAVSGSLSGPITLGVFIPAFSILAMAYGAAKWSPVSCTREIARRALYLGAAYAAIMLLIRPLFTINSGDLQIPGTDFVSGANASFGLGPDFFSTLVHAFVFAALFGAVGTWLAVQAGNWRSTLAARIRNDDGLIPSWAHAAVAAFIASQVLLCLVLTITGLALIEKQGYQGGSDATTRSSACLAVVNYAPAAAGTAYCFLVGAPLQVVASATTGNGGYEGFSASASLFSGVSDNRYTTALPWYIYLAALFPIAALVAGGMLAASRTSHSETQNVLCLKFAAVHAGLLVLLLPAYRFAADVSGSAGAGDFQGGVFSASARGGPTFFGSLFAGLIVGFLACRAGGWLWGRPGSKQPVRKGSFCPECGTSNDTHAAYCEQCGSKL